MGLLTVASVADKTCFDILLNSGAVKPEALEKAFRESERNKISFSQLVVQNGLLKESDMLSLYSGKLGIPYVNLKTCPVDKSLVNQIPVKFANYYKFFPLKLHNRKLTIATSKLLDIHILDEIRLGLGFDIEVVFAVSKDIEEMIMQTYGLGAETVDKILTQAHEEAAPSGMEPQIQVEDIEKLAETASVVQLVNQIILDAYRKGASDIHIEPFRERVRLRYRVDGVLHEARVPPDFGKFFLAILSRIKIMANLNIVEKRLPQDGKARVKTQDQTMDLRISSMPTPFGESMVIRILPSKMILGLEDLGFEHDHLQTFQELISRPHGVIFLTGPTGSGKSTTLYAALHAINTVEQKVITIEDPVEYEMGGITQIQVMPEIGLTFGRGLRSMLRHDPDVMMVGEVRDLETADIAIRAALTGHLILSTLHTNDAASGVARLLDIGIQPYLIASSVTAFVAQRLVRVICGSCKREDPHPDQRILGMIRKELALGPKDPVSLYRGNGCDDCSGTGYRGRMAIHEILNVDDAIRQLIYERSAADRIKDVARNMGMRTLRQDGWKKVIKAATTPDEILEIAPDDESLERLSPKHSGAIPHVFSAESRLDQAHERRRYARVKVRFPVAYRLIMVETDKASADKGRYDQWHVAAESDNMSASGVVLISDDTIKMGDVLEIKMEMPDGGKPIQCIARVVRVTYIEKEGRMVDAFSQKIAVTYLAINSVDRLRIENFCMKQM